MKARKFKIRNQCSYVDGQRFVTFLGNTRTLKQFGSLWNFLNQYGEEYQGRKTTQELLEYIKRNRVTLIVEKKVEKALDNSDLLDNLFA